MAEQGIRDFQTAKQKACERLGVPSNLAPLPSNQEIEQAVTTRLRLFTGADFAARLQQRLNIAVEAMVFLAEFEPRLVGALARGVATERTPVELHVFADTSEDIAWLLAAHRIPCEPFDKRVRFARSRNVTIPAFRYAVDDTMVEVIAFPPNGIRQAPICPVEGRPMRRSAVKRVHEMLEEVRVGGHMGPR